VFILDFSLLYEWITKTINNLWMGLVKGFFLVLNTTFNNISVISWRSVLLVEETGVARENNRHAASNKLYHIMLYTSPWAWFELATSVVIGTDCIGSCKFNHHTITTTRRLLYEWVFSYFEWVWFSCRWNI
jgi:hypothetical protein